MLENDCRFQTDAARALSGRLDPALRARFGFDPAALDWRAYWTEVHVPGLQRWVYPDLEGRRPERGPKRPVDLRPAEADAAPSPTRARA